jgi:hypothetical protein
MKLQLFYNIEQYKKEKHIHRLEAKSRQITFNHYSIYPSAVNL